MRKILALTLGLIAAVEAAEIGNSNGSGGQQGGNSTSSQVKTGNGNGRQSSAPAPAPATAPAPTPSGSSPKSSSDSNQAKYEVSAKSYNELVEYLSHHQPEKDMLTSQQWTKIRALPKWVKLIVMRALVKQISKGKTVEQAFKDKVPEIKKMLGKYSLSLIEMIAAMSK